MLNSVSILIQVCERASRVSQLPSVYITYDTYKFNTCKQNAYKLYVYKYSVYKLYIVAYILV